jgi:hypothetical protein
VFGLFLVFGAIKALLSWMDDRPKGDAVTEFLADFRSTNFFVTRNRPALSASVGWTGFVLHG